MDWRTMKKTIMYLIQGIIRTEILNYKLGLAVLAESRMLDTLKRNFNFM